MSPEKMVKTFLRLRAQTLRGFFDRLKAAVPLERRPFLSMLFLLFRLIRRVGVRHAVADTDLGEYVFRFGGIFSIFRRIFATLTRKIWLLPPAEGPHSSRRIKS